MHSFQCITIGPTRQHLPTPLAGFYSKFYLFFTALGCGATFLALVGVVSSVIGRWAAGRLPRVSQFGGPKAVLRAPVGIYLNLFLANIRIFV
ncbi:hypothetical protein ACS0TY_008918 [Phlomoides rotata]